MAAVAVIEVAVPLFVRPDDAVAPSTGEPGDDAPGTAVRLRADRRGDRSGGGSAARIDRADGLDGTTRTAQLVLGIVALDFAYGYLAHRTMHMAPVLWRFHRVHHSDPFVDVTTSFRTHPVEIACGTLAVRHGLDPRSFPRRRW
jgi:hypothetical protein